MYHILKAKLYFGFYAYVEFYHQNSKRKSHMCIEFVLHQSFVPQGGNTKVTEQQQQNTRDYEIPTTLV